MAHWSRTEISSDIMNRRFNQEFKDRDIGEVVVQWNDSIDQSSRWMISFRNTVGHEVGRFRFGQIFECCGAGIAYVARVCPHVVGNKVDTEFLLSMIEWCGRKVNIGSVYIVVRNGQTAYNGLKNINGEVRKGWNFVFENKNPRSHNILYHWVGKVSEFQTQLDR